MAIYRDKRMLLLYTSIITIFLLLLTTIKLMEQNVMKCEYEWIFIMVIILILAVLCFAFFTMLKQQDNKQLRKELLDTGILRTTNLGISIIFNESFLLNDLPPPYDDYAPPNYQDLFEIVVQ